MTEQPRSGEPGPADRPAQPPAPEGYRGPPIPPYAHPAPVHLPPPGHPWQPAPWQPAPWQPAPWYDPHDPLVNPPGAGLSGWFARAVDLVRRSWRVLLPIMIITQFLPGLVVSLVQLAYNPGRSLAAVPPPAPDGQPPQLPEGFGTDLAVFGLASLVAGVVVALVQSLGWAAGTWAATRHATAQPAPLGAALAYGVRRSPGLWLWSVLSGVIVLAGLCLCVLPGIYFAFALSLVGPVFLFERRNPVGRSFGLFHRRFGMVLGRLALLAAVLVAGGIAASMLAQIGLLATGAGPFGQVDLSPGTALAYSLSAALAVPLGVVQLAGLLVTYAEQRGHERPTTASTLAAELG